MIKYLLKIMWKALRAVIFVYCLGLISLVADIAQLIDFNILDIIKKYAPTSYRCIVGLTLILYIIAFAIELIKLNNLDSALKYHEEPRNLSRFHYCNERSKFIGRNDQLKRLKDFCLCNKDAKLHNHDFAWWVLTGEGGTGKSRLCYELAKIMKRSFWSVCILQNHTPEKLLGCKEVLLRNTLFIIDYAEYNADLIFSWIASFNANEFSRKKIRILLIQRRGSWEDIEDSINGELADGFIEATLYDKKFLYIERLELDNTKNKSLLIEIMKSYAKKQKKRILSLSDCDSLFNLLNKVDTKLLRPLYALVITDAYLDNKKRALEWEKGDVLDYICDKEEAKIMQRFKSCFSQDQFSKVFKIGCEVKSLATIVGGFVVSQKMEDFMNPEYNWLLSHNMLERFLRNDALFNHIKDGKVICPPLEPDIIGEYFVLRMLRNQVNSGDISSILLAAWNEPYYMSRFMNRLFQDYEELVNTSFSLLKEILSEISLPNITKIPDETFYGCSWLTKIELPNSVTSIGTRAFMGCTKLSQINIPNHVTFIGNRAFSGCRQLTHVEIPDSVNAIGGRAFSGCLQLAQIKLPSSITIIEARTFSGCATLKRINLSDSIKFIEARAFNGCYLLEQVEIPDSVECLGDKSFNGCKQFLKIDIPSSVRIIGAGAFAGCTKVAQISIPDSVEIIGSNAFAGCKKVVQISVPDSVKSIGAGAFSGCEKVTQIKLPSTIAKIENGTFRGCEQIAYIEIPNSVTSIGSHAFENCAQLAVIRVPDSINYIGDGAFCGCKKLTRIKIPDSVRNVGVSLFADCISLTYLELPSSLKRICAGAFRNCRKLTSFCIPEQITSIENKCFSGCVGLTEIRIPTNITNIGRMAFMKCTGLTQIEIPASVTEIGDRAFMGCTRLTKINMLCSADKINDATFSGCKELTGITLPNTVTSIGRAAFHWCGKLTQMEILGHITSIDEFAFDGCNNLTDIQLHHVLSDNVISIFRDLKNSPSIHQM